MKKLFPSEAVVLAGVILFPLFSRGQGGTNSATGKTAFQEELRKELVRCERLTRLVTDSFPGTNTSVRPAMKKLLDSAIRSSDRAMDLADSSGDRRSLGDLYKNRAPLEAMRGDFEQAHNFYINGWNINDSVSSQQKKNEIAELQGKQDLETKDQEIALHKAQAATQRRALMGLATGIGLLGVIGALLFRENRRRKKTSVTLLVINNELEKANQIKARFFGILSHDLRSPIANLLGFLHLIRTEPDLLSPAEMQEHQQGISRSTEHLLETMEAMLLWSKEQMNSFKPEIRMIRVSDLFEYLQKFFSYKQGLPVRFINPGNLQLPGDENYLRVIMQNVTSNAMKVLNDNPDGLIEWRAEREEGRTVLSVTDNGPGISDTQIAALFTETAAVNARTGFGFHLIRDLARAIQYSISFDSRPGMGTTFRLKSPAVFESNNMRA